MTSFSKASIVALIVVLFATVALIQQYQSMQSLEHASEEKALDPVLPGVPADLPRLVNLKIETCIQCKRMIPVFAELERQFSDRFTVHTFDLSRNKRAGTVFGVIRIVPTLIFMDQAGRELYRFEGYMSKAEILERWQALGITI